MQSKMNQLFKDQRSVHVLYAYKEMDNYLEQVMSYIQNGITAGDHVILIENEPIYRMIHKKLSSQLTEEQMEMVHPVNSFNFYFSSGSYHPPAILDYFNKTVQPYVIKFLSDHGHMWSGSLWKRPCI
ncbi:MEDS domain-containing protein [Bacillus taeanensis]|uniref:MEDS domain-containing protein n=1 Tax=Bacillus taeanensis TaxID=273032 RepID=UPI00267DAB5F